MAKKGQAIFLVYTDLADPAYEEEFNAWYDTEHLPELLALPGFLDGARYVASKSGPKYLAVYELETADAMTTPEFKSRSLTPWGRRVAPTVIGKNLTRIVGQQFFPETVQDPDRGMAPALQIGRMSVPPDREAEWNAWYNGEFIPGFSKVPGVITARRYRVVQGEVNFTTVYEFEHDQVSDSEEWNYQRFHSSTKSDQMRPIMTHGFGSPGVYRRIDP